MSLNIKNERVHALVREAAAKTGLSQTAVVERAVEEFLQRATRDEREQRARATLARIHAIVAETEGPTTSDFLYDPDTGLPA